MREFTLIELCPLSWSKLDEEWGFDEDTGDRLAQVYSANGDSIGCLTHNSPGSFKSNAHGSSDDVRWRCLSWIELMQQFAQSIVAAYGEELQISGIPEMTIIRRGNDSAAAYLYWNRPDGGGVWLMDTRHQDTCGECIGCRAVVPPTPAPTPVTPPTLTGSWVYFIQARDGDPVKIGYSNNPEARRSSIQTSSPHPVRILAKMHGARVMEQAIHTLFTRERIRDRGEWFHPSKELLVFISEIATHNCS